MAITIWEFIDQGGTVAASGGFKVENVVLIANTNPYPISGNVRLTTTLTTPMTWSANGVPNTTPLDSSLYLNPVKNTVNYFIMANSSLSFANSYVEWANTYNTHKWLI